MLPDGSVIFLVFGIVMFGSAGAKEFSSEAFITIGFPGKGMVFLTPFVSRLPVELAPVCFTRERNSGGPVVVADDVGFTGLFLIKLCEWPCVSLAFLKGEFIGLAGCSIVSLVSTVFKDPTLVNLSTDEDKKLEGLVKTSMPVSVNLKALLLFLLVDNAAVEGDCNPFHEAAPQELASEVTALPHDDEEDAGAATNSSGVGKTVNKIERY